MMRCRLWFPCQQAWKSPSTALFALDCHFGVKRGCLLVRGIPRFHGSLEPVHQIWTLFSASSFYCNFQANDNQTFIVYAKSILVLYRKGLCGIFPVLGFALEEKLCGAKCSHYFRPEGVVTNTQTLSQVTTTCEK